MADEEQLAILKQGVGIWNEWRSNSLNDPIDLTFSDLGKIDLTEVNFRNANLHFANLTDATLHRADLVRADLSDATMIEARLWEANLAEADLTRAILSHSDFTAACLLDANLYRASMSFANMSHATLTGANLFEATLDETILVDIDLSDARGLEGIRHRGPSTLDSRTLMKSDKLPLQFLRGCGLPDRLIDYLPSLFSAKAIQFYSCFISFATANQDFADRLHADLQARSIRCWFAPHDMKPGRTIHEQIDEAIRVYDRLVLILSAESMSSRWVKTEIARARKKEVASRRRVLFPVALVPFGDIRTWEQFDSDLGDDSAREIREYFIPDFSDWKTNHDSYQRAFEKVVKALQSADGAGTA